MHVSKVLVSMKDASIYMRMSTDMITPDGGKAKATLGAIAHATSLNVYRIALDFRRYVLYEHPSWSFLLSTR